MTAAGYHPSMSTTRLPVIAAATALLACALASPAAAERYDEDAVSLGAQTLAADVVALVRTPDALPDPLEPGESERLTVEVVRTLVREPHVDEEATGPGSALAIAHRELGHGRPFRAGGVYVAFLRTDGHGRGDPAAQSLSSVAGTFSWVAVRDQEATAPGPVERYVERFRDARTRRSDGDVEVVGVDGIGTALVDALSSRHLLVAGSAARDLRIFRTLHDELDDTQRLRLLDRFREHVSRPDGLRPLLARLCAVLPTEETVPALVDALTAPAARVHRHVFAECLRLLDDPRTATLIRERWNGANVDHRQNLMNAAGLVEDPALLPLARSSLADGSVAVRIEAAHALGLLARAARRAEPDLVVEGRPALVRALGDAKTTNERRATVWCLAQLDDPAAYEHLRSLAASKSDAELARLAGNVLRRPRSALILK